MDQGYDDKLSGLVPENVWSRKMVDWREQEEALEATLGSLFAPVPEDAALPAQKILELANLTCVSFQV